MSVFRRVAVRSLLPALALIAALVAVYAPALRGDFLWDDDAHITGNPTVVGPLGLKEIWTTAHANYFPLVLTSFRLQHALWGLNPAGYHLVTLACHAAAALLLWRVLAALVVPGSSRRSAAEAGAWLGAALWALHPLQVESVAWICELKNTQSAVFFLAAIWFWLRHAERLPRPAAGIADAAAAPVSRDYFLALLCALGAILSKSSTVMLPVVLGLCTWWQGGRIGWRQAASLAPFFLLSAAAAGWTIWEQAYRQQAYGGEWALSLAQRCLVAGRAGWFYFLKLIWPANLTFIYPRWEIDPTRAAAWLPGVAALAGLGWLTWRHRRARAALFAAVFFLALLFPVLGFFNVYFFRFSFVGDHFQYLASIGPLALAGALLARLPARIRVAASAACVGALALLTATQSRAYHDPESLWRATLARNPQAWMAWSNLGQVVGQQGRHDEAIACYQRALALNPADAQAHHNLGFEALMARQLPEALEHFERALAVNPGDARTQNGYGFALALSDRVAEAVPHYERALQIVPDFSLARRNLALALASLGRTAEAVTHYERAIALQPGDAVAHRELANALGELGRWTDAAAHYEMALRAAAPTAGTEERLAIACAHAGRPDEAQAAFERALALDPEDPEIHQEFGLFLRAAGRTGEAADHLARAAALGGQPKP